MSDDRILTHLSADGTAAMVDVTDKPSTERRATAEGHIVMSPAAFAAVRDHQIKKGDVLGVARIAGIQAAKRTADLIPLCHPLAVRAVELHFTLDESLPGVRVRGEVGIVGPTGVEMEALTAVSVALLTIYDMAKSADKTMRIEGIRLTAKSGGRSGTIAL